jgi:hypothetical protein
MREAWRELLMADEQTAVKAERNPVAPARRSPQALQKIADRILEDGTPVHSFQTLLLELSTIVRNTCKMRNAGAGTFPIVTVPNTTQRRALQLVEPIGV